MVCPEVLLEFESDSVLDDQLESVIYEPRFAIEWIILNTYPNPNVCEILDRQCYHDAFAFSVAPSYYHPEVDQI